MKGSVGRLFIWLSALTLLGFHSNLIARQQFVSGVFREQFEQDHMNSCCNAAIQERRLP